MNKLLVFSLLILITYNYYDFINKFYNKNIHDNLSDICEQSIFECLRLSIAVPIVMTAALLIEIFTDLRMLVMS